MYLKNTRETDVMKQAIFSRTNSESDPISFFFSFTLLLLLFLMVDYIGVSFCLLFLLLLCLFE